VSITATKPMEHGDEKAEVNFAKRALVQLAAVPPADSIATFITAMMVDPMVIASTGREVDVMMAECPSRGCKPRDVRA